MSDEMDRRRILLITEEKELPDVVQDAAQKMGAVVMSGDSNFSLQGYDAVVCYMPVKPGMDIEETARYLKEFRNSFDVPVLLLTRSGKTKIRGSNWPTPLIKRSVDSTVLLNFIDLRPADAVDHIVAETISTVDAYKAEKSKSAGTAVYPS